MDLLDVGSRHEWLRFDLMGLNLETEGEYWKRLGICERIMGTYHWVPLGQLRPLAGSAAHVQGDSQDSPTAAPATQEEP